jgi:hypothetical protein
MTPRIALALVFAVACTPPAKTTPHVASAFGCAGPPAAVAAAPAPPSGRVTVQKIGEGPDGPRLRIWADNAPASEVALQIGETLGAMTEIDHALDAVPVTVFIPDITVDLLGAVLRTSHVRLFLPDWRKEHVLVFRSSNDAPEAPPIESRLLPIYTTMAPEQVAGLFCHSVASADGSAQVVGNRVMVTDRRNRVERFVTLLEQIEPAH